MRKQFSFPCGVRKPSCSISNRRSTRMPLSARELRLTPRVTQIGRHPLEVLFEEADDLLEGLGVYPVHGHLLQCRERCAGLLLIGAVLEDAPHAAKERAQTPTCG